MFTLIKEPDDGMQSVYDFIGTATPESGLDMTMYELDDQEVLNLFAQAAANGVGPRVLLNASDGSRARNESAYEFLAGHKVNVQWASLRYEVTHQKSIRVGTQVMVMTLNAQTVDYATSRDFAVIDADPVDAAAVKMTFEADLVGAAITPPVGNHLVWGPTNAHPVMLDLINGAAESLIVESEEISDPEIVTALGAKAKSGLSVKVVMTDAPNWKADFDRLAAAGVEISTYALTAPLYIHAKVTIADVGLGTQAAFIGSENDCTVSLTKNRELGLRVTDAALITALDATLASDFEGGKIWP